MHTVATLIAALVALPVDTPVHTVIVERSGHYADHHCADVAGVDVNLDDRGHVTGVWLTATASRADAPAVLTVRCECGEQLVVDDTNPWPEQHRWCHQSARPLPPPID